MPRSMPRMPRWLAPCKDPNSPNPGKETIPNPPLWLLTLIVIRWSSSRVHSKRKRFKISWVVEIFRFWAHFQGRPLLTNSIYLHFIVPKRQNSICTPLPLSCMESREKSVKGADQVSKFSSQPAERKECKTWLTGKFALPHACAFFMKLLTISSWRYKINLGLQCAFLNASNQAWGKFLRHHHHEPLKTVVVYEMRVLRRVAARVPPEATLGWYVIAKEGIIMQYFCNCGIFVCFL